jgi:ATP-dependent Lhr-like helicase
MGREPPDILLATPESIEVVLVSRRVDHRVIFRDLRVVIVDEIHAFAGDDRGWHLIALLDRLRDLTKHPIQRLGLSATVGNAEELLAWLCADESGPRSVVSPEASTTADVDLKVDYVGSLPNAATVISRLHRGEKRLVFCDSRSQVVSLAVELRALGVTTFVSHSSLSVDERRRAEAAFSAGTDCVIAATSTLELGIDVGDLDRVIQIDAPSTVAAFLQRLGRTGRRPGTQRNCLFLATSEAALLKALGLLRLWSEGYVEPVVPPALPYHVLAQQILALILQEGGVSRAEFLRSWAGFRQASGITVADAEAIVEHMLHEDVLFNADGVLVIGTEGEARYGLKNFLELFSVFNSPPLFRVLHGRNEVGQVHQLTFQSRDKQPVILALAGRLWAVKHVDWNRRQAFVEPSDQGGRSRWLGSGPGMSFELAQSIKRVLVDETIPAWLSRRAADALRNSRESFDWLVEDATTLEEEALSWRWWTFAGNLANAAVAAYLQARGWTLSSDALVLKLKGVAHDLPGIKQILIEGLTAEVSAPVASDNLDTLKFGASIPKSQLELTARARFDTAKARRLIASCPIAISRRD